MIEYFSTSETTRTLTKLAKEEEGCWIALFCPTPEEIEEMSQRFSIDRADLVAPLDPDEVSRIEHSEHYTMYILDTPVRDETRVGREYKTLPIAVFETPHHVVSVCSAYRIPLIARLRNQRGLYETSNVAGFVCDLLIASSKAYFSSLQNINRRRIELTSVTRNPTRKDLEELYTLDASLVYFKTSLTTNDNMLERYRRNVRVGYDKDIYEHFDDVIVENRQALETTKIYSEILDSAIDHFGLMMDYDLNRTMQLVATLTLVLCVPTIVGGFFGMNLEGIPLANSPYGFALVTIATVLLLIVLLFVLKKLRWF